MKIDAWFVSALRVTHVSKFDLDRKNLFGHCNLLEDLSSYMISNLRFSFNDGTTASQRKNEVDSSLCGKR